MTKVYLDGQEIERDRITIEWTCLAGLRLKGTLDEFLRSELEDQEMTRLVKQLH